MLQAINVIAAVPPTLSSRDQFLFEEEISLRSPPLSCSGKALPRKDHSGGKMVDVKPGIRRRDFRKEGTRKPKTPGYQKTPQAKWLQDNSLVWSNLGGPSPAEILQPLLLKVKSTVKGHHQPQGQV